MRNVALVGLALLPLLFLACLSGIEPTSNDAGVQLAHDAAAPSSADGAMTPGPATDGGAFLAGDMAKPPLDLVATDLTGLYNCYGVAVCDPLQAFCLKFHSGSAAAPGTLGGPACYEPSTPCADNGQAMDCGCIQNDAGLGAACQGSCVDNGDGSFDCYAK